MARNVVDELVVRLVADATKLRNELNTVEKDAKKQADEIGKGFAASFKAAATFGAAAAASIGAVAGALTKAADKAADYADRIDKASQSTGFSRGAFQELTFALDQNGIAFDAARQGLQDFNARLGQAAAGNKSVAETYDRLGIALRDVNGNVRDSDAVFTDVLAALSELPSASAQAAEGALLLGEEFSRRVIPALNSGAEGIDALRDKARELGIVLDDESVGALVAYKDQLAALNEQFGSVARDITVEFLPVLTEGVLPALEATIRVFRNMPEPLQRAAAALTGFGTAATAAAVGLRLLGVPLAALFGPAGAAIAAVGVIGTLAFALSGTGKDQLPGAVADARDALAGGDAASLTGALSEVISKVDGPVKDSLIALQEELVRTGDVGVEAANRIAEALGEAAIAPIIAQRTLLAGEIEQIERLIASNRDVGAAGSRRDAIFAEFGPVLDAGGTIPFAITQELLELDGILEGAAASASFLARQEQLLIGRREELARVDAEIEAGRVGAIQVPNVSVVGSRGVPVGGSAGSTAAAGVAPVDRTLADVFRELGEAGARSVATTVRLIASGVDDAEAREDDLRGRLRLLESARSEALTDFYDVVTDAQLGYLQQRIAATEAELAALTADAVNAAPGQFSMLGDRGRARGDGGVGALIGAQAFDENPLFDPRILRTFAFQQGQEAASVRAAFLSGLEAGAVGDRGRLRGDGGLEAAAAVLAARALQAFDEDPGSRGIPSRAGVDALLRRQADDAAALAAFLDQLGAAAVGDTGRTRGDGGLAEAAAVLAAQALQRAVQAFDESPGTTGGAFGVSAFLAAQARRTASVQAFDESPGGPGLSRDVIDAGFARRPALDLVAGNPIKAIDDAANVTVKAAQDAADIDKQAAEQFALTVARAGVDLATALKAGDAGGIFGSLSGGIGSILSLIPGFALAGGLISIIGGGIAGFLPDGQDDSGESRAVRAAGVTPGGAPAIEFNVTQNNTLAVNSIPELRGALAGTVDQLARVVQTVLLPRVEGLEARP